MPLHPKTSIVLYVCACTKSFLVFISARMQIDVLVWHLFPWCIVFLRIPILHSTKAKWKKWLPSVLQKEAFFNVACGQARVCFLWCNTFLVSDAPSAYITSGCKFVQGGVYIECPTLCQALCDSFPQRDISLLCCRRGNAQQHRQQQKGPVSPPHGRHSQPNFLSVSSSRCEINTPLESRGGSAGPNITWWYTSLILRSTRETWVDLFIVPSYTALDSFPTMHCSPLLSGRSLTVNNSVRELFPYEGRRGLPLCDLCISLSSTQEDGHRYTLLEDQACWLCSNGHINTRTRTRTGKPISDLQT